MYAQRSGAAGFLEALIVYAGGGGGGGGGGEGGGGVGGGGGGGGGGGVCRRAQGCASPICAVTAFVGRRRRWPRIDTAVDGDHPRGSQVVKPSSPGGRNPWNASGPTLQPADLSMGELALGTTPSSPQGPERASSSSEGWMPLLGSLW